MNNELKNAANILLRMKSQQPTRRERRWSVDKLVDRFESTNGRIFFTVQWSDGSFTDEPRNRLVEDIPTLVQKWEQKTPRKSRRNARRKSRRN